MKGASITVLSSILAISTIITSSPANAAGQKEFASTPKPGLPAHSANLPSSPICPYKLLTVLGEPSAIVPAFNIPANNGWAKVWVKNNGLDTVVVTVTQGKETGHVKMQFKVPPGQQNSDAALSPWSTGNHVVSVSPSLGNPVNVSLTVKLATTKGKL
ncbi:hypothetical protein ACE6ED_08905 [Paenibacillus sp. CN-4]|uniref:hypothetical protein n=1 Tax=Paenibacillus nanchangensis TaxID=3348343 RepID=UPI00397CC79D